MFNIFRNAVNPTVTAPSDSGAMSGNNNTDSSTGVFNLFAVMPKCIGKYIVRDGSDHSQVGPESSSQLQCNQKTGFISARGALHRRVEACRGV
ncbi:MAG: hypothetical protein QS748_12320 [Candidatus Endonucleobacter bathymodioli]|uniref:Uncharacterized protein n=1 Tax=Candidatus Endonucleibacter bathymodioli TaxID=539814 RepID=A0AA90NN94_9GAMM|nr:hypothetical protein [Candidatus Endonucleobacter bathymodioli]